MTKESIRYQKLKLGIWYVLYCNLLLRTTCKSQECWKLLITHTHTNGWSHWKNVVRHFLSPETLKNKTGRLTRCLQLKNPTSITCLLGQNSPITEGLWLQQELYAPERFFSEKQFVRHCDVIIAVEAKVPNFQHKLCKMSTNRLSQAVRIEFGRQISLLTKAEVD